MPEDANNTIVTLIVINYPRRNFFMLVIFLYHLTFDLSSFKLDLKKNYFVFYYFTPLFFHSSLLSFYNMLTALFIKTATKYKKCTDIAFEA